MTEIALLDVLCFGEALIDFFPASPGLPLAEVETFHRHLGGALANVAVGLGRLGRRVGLMTQVGRDDFGVFLRRRLAAEGVDVSTLGTHPHARTGVTFVTLGPGGERSFLSLRYPSADQQIPPEAVDPQAVARAHILHLGSSTLAREPARSATWKALAAARAAGRLVSVDVNLRLHLWDDRAAALDLVRALVAQADLVKVAEDELEPLLGTSDAAEGAQRLRALGPAVAVVTLGARGAYFAAAAGADTVPGLVVQAVDATGAGDAFMAGLLARLGSPGPRGLLGATGRRLADIDLETLRAACALGNRMGAAAVTALGATAGLPPRGQVP
jgi:fructokinase